jgi:hypothetical protein
MPFRKFRRLRAVRSDRLEPGDAIKITCRAEELDAKRARARARYHRRRLELAKPPAGWSYQDRSQAARLEAEAHVAVQAAVKEGRLSAGALLDLAAGLYFAGPRPAPPRIEPAIWTGPERYSYGSPTLDAERAAEIRELRRQGWSTGKLARRFGVTRSTICNVLRNRTRYLPPSPSPPLIIPSSDDTPRISAIKQGQIITAPWRKEGSNSESEGSPFSVHKC